MRNTSVIAAVFLVLLCAPLLAACVPEPARERSSAETTSTPADVQGGESLAPVSPYTPGANAAATHVFSQTPTLAATQPITYVVQSGDTLGRIATWSGTTIDKLAQVNGIADVDLIEVGQVLTLPHGAEMAARVATPVQSATAKPTFGLSPVPTDVPPAAIPQRVPAQVLRVIDGDTIEVSIEGQTYKVRYIGIDTPETVHPEKPVEWMGLEATEANRRLVGGQTVLLEKDVSEIDKYGHLLRYVWVGELMVDAELVRLGFAQVSTYPPDVRYQDTFLQLQREARDAERGLWGPTLTPTTEIVVMPTLPPVGRTCCKYCCKGKACGDGCISRKYTCHKPPGCACNRCR